MTDTTLGGAPAGHELLRLCRPVHKALEEGAARADELAAQDDYYGQEVWRGITDAVTQLANMTPPGPAPLTT